MIRLIKWLNRNIQKLTATPEREATTPKKITLGKANKGFDFLGKRILPIGILPSASALSRMQKKTIQLYEQGASKKRIGLVWKRWLCWASILWLTASGSAFAVGVGAHCGSATDTNGTATELSDQVAAQVLAIPNGCRAIDSASWKTTTTPFGSGPLAVLLNTVSDSVPLAVNTFSIHGHATVSRLALDGVPFTSGTNVLLTTALAYSATVTYEFGGLDLTFTVTKDADSNTLNSFTVSEVVAAPEIDVQRPASTTIEDEGSDAQGSQTTGSETTLTYTIANTGDAELLVTAIEGSNETNVTLGIITNQTPTVVAGGTTTFDVPYTPTADGDFSFKLKITSDDSNEADYNIAVSGTASTPASSSGGSDDSGGTTTEEPTEQPTGASATGNSDDGSVQVTWTDTNESPNYAVFCNTTGIFTDPVDGTAQTTDSSCDDGSGVQTVEQSSQAKAIANTTRSKAAQKNASISTAWAGLSAGTTYYFKIFPYNGSGSSVDYNVDGTPLEVNATTSGTSVATNKGVFGGEKVTPSIYKVTVSKIEFKNAQGAFVTLAEGGSSFDVASVSSNSSVGTFGQTAVLPNGTYSQIRVTLARSFDMSFSGSDKGVACRTNTGGSTASVSSNLTSVSIGSSDGGTASQQQISFPSGSSASSALSTAGISESADVLQVTAAASFSVTDNSIPPSISINIDVADSAEVLTSGGNCNVIPQPPSVNVTVGG